MIYDLKPKWGIRTYQEGGSEKISENEMPCIRKIPKEETCSKYGDASRKIEIGAIGNNVEFARIPSSGIPGRASLIEGGSVYTVGNKPISAAPDQNMGLRWRK